MDYFYVIGTGLLVIVGYVTGALVIRRVRKPIEKFPTCSCHHELAFHDLADNTCHFEVRRVHYRDRGSNQGQRYGKEWVQCPCQKYTGPKPNDELFDPGMIWPHT